MTTEEMQPELPSPRGEGLFLTTRWSRVIRARDLEGIDSAKALEGLCRDYWKPLYHFARRKGNSQEDAQDLTQGFIAQLLASDSFGKALPERGRFRTFLMGAFGHYMAKEHRDASAQKRGGGVAMSSLDESDIEAQYVGAEQMTPERLYERTWALSLLERVLLRLRGEYEEAGRLDLYEALQPHMTGGSSRPNYAKIGNSLGMGESAVTVTMHRMRKRYGALVREEIADTVADAAEVDDELRHLLAILSESSGSM